LDPASLPAELVAEGCSGLAGLRQLCRYKPTAVVLCREGRLGQLARALEGACPTILHIVDSKGLEFQDVW
jgi:hypothetical protein